VVDPTVLYSTYLGGTAGDTIPGTFGSQLATGIAVDSSGNAYIVGNTIAIDFPTTSGSFQPSAPSGTFITKVNATGSALVYSTYLGSHASTTAIAIDSSGQAYVTGTTDATYWSQSFPTTANAYGPTCSLRDFYVSKLNAAGNSLLYSSCFDIGIAGQAIDYGYYPHAITVDSSGRVYVAGGAFEGVPTTPTAYQASFPGGGSAYLAIFDTTAAGAASLAYATFLGPSNANENAIAYGVAVDSFGKVYLTGRTLNGFPVTPGAFQTVHSSAPSDAFVAKLDPSIAGNASLLYSTYIGAAPACTSGCPGTYATAVAVDGSGSAYVTGWTDSPHFPTTPGAFQSPCPGSSAFVSKVSAGGSQLVYSTCVAGNAYAGSTPGGIAIDSLGNAYIAGAFAASALSTFPVTPNAFQKSFSKLSGGGSEAFVAELNATGSGLIYSSYLGGNKDDQATSIAIDQTGDAYVAGLTTSTNFPVTPTAFQKALRLGGYSIPQAAFVTKFPLGGVQTLSISSLSPGSGGNSGTVTVSIQGGGFHTGASVSLVGGSTITANAPVVGTEGRTISAPFELAGASVGLYAIRVTNPDGSTVSLPNAFTVSSGGSSTIDLSLTGLAVNHHSDTSVVLETTISNTGTVDGTGGLLVLPLNDGFTLTSGDFTVISTTSESAGQLQSLNTGASQTRHVAIGPIASITPGQSQVVTSTASSTLGEAVCSALWGPVCYNEKIAEFSLCLAQAPPCTVDTSLTCHPCPKQGV
jgi:hypothetical protein